MLDAAGLGRVLFLGAGVVRFIQRGERRIIFRASGSAGARFPLEVYACTRGVDGVPDGVHWYDGEQHALVPGRPPPTGGDARTLVVTGVPWRTGWRYAERGWRHLYWDAGTLLSQLEAAAASAGLDPRLRTLFPDARIRDLVGADGVHEVPIALLTLGEALPRSRRPGPRRRAPAAGRVPARHRGAVAGERDELGAAWPVGPPVAEAPESPTVDDVVRRRGSQRRMVRGASVPLDLLTWPMDVAMRGIDVPHWVVVHSVDGVEPGVYRWPDLSARPAHRPRPRHGELCATSWSGSAWASRSAPRRRTSSSPPPTRRPSTTAPTATPSSRPGSSRAGCTSRRTPAASVPRA